MTGPPSSPEALRVLVISNLYPPHHLGGYEVACKDIVDGLTRRGHDVRVLTSTYGVGRPVSDGHVLRWLCQDSDWGGFSEESKNARVIRKEWINQRAFLRIARSFKPDVVYICNPVWISVSLAMLADRLGIATAFFVGDDWSTIWSPQTEDRYFRVLGRPSDRWWASVAKSTLESVFRAAGLMTTPSPLNYDRMHYISSYLKQDAVRRGRGSPDAKIVNWGVDTSSLPYQARNGTNVERLLCVGRLRPEKGIDIAIRALMVLRELEPDRRLSLDIVGGHADPVYLREIENLVRDAGLGDSVRFRGPLSRADLALIYGQHEILLFTSTWDEPFGVTILEAMSSGLAVVGSRVGGAAGIFQDGCNGLLFDRGDVRGCASQVQRLLRDPQLRQCVQQNARRTIEERYRIEDSIAQIERLLWEMVVERRESPVSRSFSVGVS